MGGISGAPAVHAADAPSPLVLEHLTMADGLPQGTVMSTLQDSQGFVWIGTEDGLAFVTTATSCIDTRGRAPRPARFRATSSGRSSKTPGTISGSP